MSARHPLSPAPVRAQRAPGAGEGVDLSLSEQSARGDQGEWINRYAEGQQVDAFRARLSNMRRTVITAAQQFDDVCGQEGVRFQRVIVTFTYRPEVAPDSGQLRKALHAMKAWVTRQGATWRCVWVLEFHKSGRPHYHAAVWLPKRLQLPKPDKRGWWPHGATNVTQGRGRVNRAGSYLAKYISKGSEAVSQKFRGARSYAVAGLDWARRQVLWYWRAPAWLSDVADPALIEGRAPGGGRRVGGRVYLSPYEWSGGCVRLADWVYQVERHA